MRHAAGAEDDHTQIFRIRFYGFLDGPAEVVAAVAVRWRVLHDIDGQRNNFARPFLGLPEHERQRHGETVVHIQVVDDGEIKLVEYEGLRDMGRQYWMAFDHRHGSRAPTFVSWLEFFGTTQCKRRNQLDRECRCVVVVDEDDDVGLDLRDPLLRKLEAFEYWCPVRRVGLAEIPRRANGRHM